MEEEEEVTLQMSYTFPSMVNTIINTNSDTARHMSMKYYTDMTHLKGNRYLLSSVVSVRSEWCNLELLMVSVYAKMTLIGR